MISFRIARVALVALAAFCAAGCSSSEFESDVSGTVTLDGSPVGPGTVVFAPTDDKSNPATGLVEVDGDYFLRSNRIRGLPPGHYKVSVSVVHYDPVAAGQRSTKPGKQITPRKYADPSTSGLEYDVEPGNNSIDIDLTSK
jgi:hypothetical protein